VCDVHTHTVMNTRTSIISWRKVWFQHALVWFINAECDFHSHSVISTHRVYFLHAEINFHTKCDLETHKCDYDTHDCDFNMHKSDFYTQSVILTRMSVITTRASVIYTRTSWISTRYWKNIFYTKYKIFLHDFLHDSRLHFRPNKVYFFELSLKFLIDG
jgi:hypothetical protein